MRDKGGEDSMRGELVHQSLILSPPIRGKP